MLSIVLELDMLVEGLFDVSSMTMVVFCSYAKVPVGIRASWNDFTKDYFLRSKSLVCVMLLVDASIPPQKIDLEYASWLNENKVCIEELISFKSFYPCFT